MFKNRMNRKIAEYQNELISKHCDEVENIYHQMRGWRHDYHNHIQLMKAYITLGKIEELSDYFDKLEQDLKTIDKIIKTGNVMLDAILNSKLSLAISRNIKINVTATVQEELKITDIDLCVLLGNILDNAIEACNENMSSSYEFDTPFIRIYIGMKGYHLYICVTNTVYKKMKKRKGSHGFGLIRIDKICSKYGGFCNRNSEPGAFSIEILLPVGKE